jgi:tripartite-type tricarboxylate transporter receptor subunit TctC
MERSCSVATSAKPLTRWDFCKAPRTSADNRRGRTPRRGAARRLSWFFAAVSTLLLLAGAATAEEWPTRPVKIVAPFAPGGTADALGRLLAESLSRQFNQQFYVENRAGGAGMLGVKLVAASEPDGYTLVLTGLGSNVIAPAYFDDANDAALRDFTYIAYIGGAPVGLFVHPSLPVRDFSGFLSWARQQREPIEFMSAGSASNSYLFALDLAQKLGFKVIHVPYKGSGSAMLDLVAGHVKVAIMSFASGSEQLRNGDIKALAVATRERLTAFPDVPTFKELGYPQFVSGSWFVLSGPKKLPEVIALKLNAAVRKALTDSQIQARLQEFGLDTQVMSLPETAAFVKAETDRWSPIAREAHLRDAQ